MFSIVVIIKSRLKPKLVQTSLNKKSNVYFILASAWARYYTFFFLNFTSTQTRRGRIRSVNRFRNKWITIDWRRYIIRTFLEHQITSLFCPSFRRERGILWWAEGKVGTMIVLTLLWIGKKNFFLPKSNEWQMYFLRSILPLLAEHHQVWWETFSQ